MSLTSSHLKTLDLHIDWDDDLIPELCQVAVFYCENGVWEGLKEEALRILEVFPRDETETTRTLRQAFNTWLNAREIVEFDDDPTSDEQYAKTEQALADELTNYCSDPELYIIVHATDERFNDEAWFLCYFEDIQELKLDKTIMA